MSRSLTDECLHAASSLSLFLQTRQPVFVQLLQGVFRVYHCNWLTPSQKAAVESCIRVLSDVGKTPPRFGFHMWKQATQQGSRPPWREHQLHSSAELPHTGGCRPRAGTAIFLILKPPFHLSKPAPPKVQSQQVLKKDRL